MPPRCVPRGGSRLLVVWALMIAAAAPVAAEERLGELVVTAPPAGERPQDAPESVSVIPGSDVETAQLLP